MSTMYSTRWARSVAVRVGCLLLCCILPVLIGCDARTVDTGSEAGITAAFAHHTGERWSSDDYCYATVPELDIVLYADFVHDVGCDYHSLLLAGERFGDVSEMRPHVFVHNGWDDVAQRTAIVQRWVEQVRASDAQVMQRIDDPFARRGYAFEPFSAELQPDNSVVARYWVQQAGGMLPVSEYTQYETHFSADGVNVTRTRLASFLAYLDPLEDAAHLLEGDWQHEAQIEDGLATFESISFSAGRFIYYAYPPLSADGVTVLDVAADGTISAELHADGQLWRTLSIEPQADLLMINGKLFSKVVADE